MIILTTVVTDIIQSAVAVGALAISFVTLRVVIVTLREQLELNRAQFKLLEIESNRAAREIRPSFSVNHHFDYKTLFFSIFCQDNIAYDIYLEMDINTIVRGLKENHIREKEHPNGYPEGLVFEGNLPLNQDTLESLTLTLVYFDEDGRRYKQQFLFDSPHRLHINPPKFFPLTKL